MRPTEQCLARIRVRALRSVRPITLGTTHRTTEAEAEVEVAVVVVEEEVEEVEVEAVAVEAAAVVGAGVEGERRLQAPRPWVAAIRLEPSSPKIHHDGLRQALRRVPPRRATISRPEDADVGADEDRLGARRIIDRHGIDRRVRQVAGDARSRPSRRSSSYTRGPFRSR